MTRQHANIIRGFAAWTLFVWVVQQRNVWSGNRSAGFKIVHTVLAVISIALAVAATWVVTQYRGRNAPTAPPAK